MDTKLITIYDILLEKLTSKDTLAEILNVTTKTIDNKVKISNGDIEYSKKLSSYYFKNLLPEFITLRFLLKIIMMNIDNKSIKSDLSYVKDLITEDTNKLLRTSELSKILQNIIQLQVAINHNCILSIEYAGGMKQIERKVIRPTQIIVTNGSLYLYAKYDERNKINIGEKRTFQINSIGNITPVEYFQGDTFKTDVSGNAFGEFNHNNFVELTFFGPASNLIKRERLNSLNYEIIEEDFDGKSVNVKFYYNSELELVKIIQQWMPYIKFTKKNDFSTKILTRIKNNFDEIYETGNPEKKDDVL